jgi:hypothetical protein
MDTELEQALEPGTAQVNPEPAQPNVETPQGQPAQVATVEKPNFYTPDEIETLISQDAEVDTTRLTAEGRLLMKSFQKGFTPKLMERQSLKQELDGLRKEMASLRQPATIEEAFDRDPEAALRHIDGQIAKERARLGGAEAFEAIQQIEDLRSIKDNLMLRGMANQRKISEINTVASRVESEVHKAIPDFAKKEPSLTEYAIRELGYSLEDIRFLTDPSNTGKYASKWILQVNKMYDMSKAKTTVEEKRVKTPPKSESAGTGGGEDQNATYTAALKKATETGDWTEVLKLKGVIQKLVPGG